MYLRPAAAAASTTRRGGGVRRRNLPYQTFDGVVGPFIKHKLCPKARISSPGSSLGGGLGGGDEFMNFWPPNCRTGEPDVGLLSTVF